jgi:integrase
LNCGYGNTDVSSLPKWALNLKAGTATFPRPKTGVDRKAFLWPETVEALQDAMANRPDPTDPADEELVFITKYGGRFVRSDGTVQVDAVGQEFAKVLSRLKLKRRGSFYVLRHTAETVGGGSRDQVAVNHIMGHVDSSMAATYREHIDDERIKVVCDHVRSWLFPDLSTQK